MKPWAVILIGLLILLSASISIYLLTKKNEEEEEEEEEETIEKAMMQGDCEKGGNVKNADNLDITLGVDVTDSLQIEMNKNPITDAVSAGWWTENTVCEGDNEYKQLVIKPKGRKEPIQYTPMSQVDTTVNIWKPET